MKPIVDEIKDLNQVLFITCQTYYKLYVYVWLSICLLMSEFFYLAFCFNLNLFLVSLSVLISTRQFAIPIMRVHNCRETSYPWRILWKELIKFVKNKSLNLEIVHIEMVSDTLVCFVDQNSFSLWEKRKLVYFYKFPKLIHR